MLMLLPTPSISESASDLSDCITHHYQKGKKQLSREYDTHSHGFANSCDEAVIVRWVQTTLDGCRENWDVVTGSQKEPLFERHVLLYKGDTHKIIWCVEPYLGLEDNKTCWGDEGVPDCK